MAGNTLQDRKLAARVRGKLLSLAEKILDGDDEVAKKDLLHKMCNGLLPRINVGGGDNGEFEVKTTLVKFLDDDESNSGGDTKGIQETV